MGYIGNQPAEKFSSFSKQTFSPDGSTTSFTLDYAVSGENELALFVNNVRQEPGSGKAYTASGTTLTMSEAPGSSDTMYGIFIGKAVQTVTPAASSVTNDMISYPLAESGATVSTFNRTTSEGSVLDIQKDGTSVGTISTNDGDLLVGTGDTGLRFYDAGDAIIPNNNSTLGNRDNAIDLGFSSIRFKDLYLGGSLRVGGTGSANALDDYEEGTFTPALAGTSGSAGSVAYTDRVGYYVKIGPIVHIQLRMVMSNLGSWGGNMYVSGLPFTVANEGAPPPMSLEIRKVTLGNYGVFAALSDGSTNLYLKEYISANDPARITISDLASNSVWIVNGTYRTTS